MAGYAPAILGKQFWTIVVLTPREVALTEIAPGYVNQIGITLVGFLVTLLLAVLVAKDEACRKGLMESVEKYRNQPEENQLKKRVK